MHDIQDNLGVKNLSDLTTKAIKDICGTKTPSKKKKKNDVLRGIYILEKLVLFIGMECRTPTAITFRTKLEFNQHDLIMTKEQSVF